MRHYILASYDPTLTNILETMMSIPFTYDILNRRWFQSTQIAIPKDPITPKLNLLRIIQLLEEDFNCYLKIKINSQLIPLASKVGKLEQGMFGVIPKRSVNHSLLLQILTHDQLNMIKSPGFTIQWDAKQCYYLILSSLLPISFTWLGSPFSIGRGISKHINNMKHIVCTTSGLSQKNNTKRTTRDMDRNRKRKWRGWTFLDIPRSPNDPSHEKLYNCVKFNDPNNRISYNNTVIAFIDDNNLTKNYTSPTTYQQMQNYSENMTNMWIQLLQASGCKLSLENIHFNSSNGIGQTTRFIS